MASLFAMAFQMTGQIIELPNLSIHTGEDEVSGNAASDNTLLKSRVHLDGIEVN